MFTLPARVGRTVADPSWSDGLGDYGVYNARLFHAWKMLLSILRNARGCVISDDDKDETYSAFVSRYRMGGQMQEDEMDLDEPTCVDLRGLHLVTTQFPQYNDVDIHVRCVVGKFGCNKAMRRKIDGWINDATAHGSGSVTRLIIFLVPTLEEMRRERVIAAPKITNPMKRYLGSLLDKAGITVEVLHLRDVEHMFAVRHKFSEGPWREGVVESPDMGARITLLTQTPYAVDDQQGGEIDLVDFLEREDTRITASDILERHACPSAVHHANTRLHHLPRISAECDLMARIFGARKGDVIRFLSPSESAGAVCVYRLVV